METWTAALTWLSIAVAIGVAIQLYLLVVKMVLRFFLSTEFTKSRLYPVTILAALAAGIGLLKVGAHDVMTGVLGLLLVVTALILSLAWEPQRKPKAK